MNAVISPNSNVVHEAEAQRQYARLKLPAKIFYRTPQGQELEAQALDLSVGGFGFEPGNTLLTEGQRFPGKLMFEIEGIGFSMDMQFQVCSLNGKRAGCEFHEMRPREMAALRYLISSVLTGELVNVGDLITTLQRENFTKPRKGKGDDKMSLAARIKALSLSAGIFLVGLAAFGYVLYRLYDVYFITHADSAQVSVPAQQVSMPREGSVQSLVKVGDMVTKGAPLATFSATMLDALKGALPESEMTPDNLERLFSKSLQGTLTSPCDCRVVAQLVGDGQMAVKGTAVFTLAPADSVATVEARFPYRAFAELQPGTQVSFLVGGESEPRSGVISSMELQDGGLASDIRVMIEPALPLASELAKRPVDVRIQPLGGLWSSNSLAAGK